MSSRIMALNRSYTLKSITKNYFKGRVLPATPWLHNKLKIGNPVVIKTHYSSMMSLESSLPKLPVPPLHQTMDKYLKAIEPLVDKDEFENSKNVVKEFSKPGGIGELLQKELEGFAKMKDNWLTGWWNSHGYLNQRVPLPINFSPVSTFPKQTFQDQQSHLKYATRVITNVLKFKKEIDNETLSIDMMGKDPLNMIQYKYLFGGIRIPRHSTDEFIQGRTDKSRHVLVAHNNQFYVFDVLDGDGRPLSESDVLTQLIRIVENNEPLEQPIGVLTAADRTFWANQRIELCKDKTNKENLDRISSAICVITLDKPPLKPTHPPVHMEDVESTVSAINGLHGGNVDCNSMNRWYDKTLHYSTTEEGYCSSLFEHTPADGPTVGRVWNYLQENEGYESISPSNASSTDLPNPLKLKWNLSSTTLDAIQTTKEKFQSCIDDTDIRCLKFEDYGKDFIKKHKLSPDAWIQMAFQLTHYRLHGCLGPNYETASLRKYYQARTENIRSTSMETLQFAQAIDNQSLKAGDKLALMVQAVKNHSKVTVEAMNAQGIDRHLFGLKVTSMELGMDLPDFFKDRVFENFWHLTISTSQVPSSTEKYTGFGPGSPDSYNLCYNPRPNDLLFSLSTVKSNPVTNPEHFAVALYRSLDSMRILAMTSKN